MNSGLPLSRAAQILPFIDFLDRLGARTDVALEKSMLPPGLRENVDTLISTRAMSHFIGDMTRREAVTDLGWRASSDDLEQIPIISGAIRHSQTLYEGLQQIRALGNRESSNIGIWLEELDESVRFCVRGSVETGTNGADELVKMRLAVLLSVIRLFAPSDWTPKDCGLAIRRDVGPVVREALGDARIQLEQDYSWLRVPRSILSRPPRVLPPDPRSSAAGPDPAPDLIGSLVQTVGPYLRQGAPSIQSIAKLTGRSDRSMQRRLTREGCCYRDIVQRAKLEIAKERLLDRNVKIVEVAYETGFTDPAHFTRFFRSRVGMTPREYRSSPPPTAAPERNGPVVA